MSSGSLKDLSKAITSSSAILALPFPEDLLAVINAYLEKHTVYDENDEKRLQEELLLVYHASIIDHPSRLAPFLRILQMMRPNLRASGRLLQWWDKLSGPIMVHLGVEKGLAAEAKNILLSILVYDEDESEKQSAKATSDTVAENLISVWLAKTKIATEEFDDHARFVKSQVCQILLLFGKKRPKDFLTTIDKFFVKKDSRILSLSLLCQFFRHQPPHLHQLLRTPLFNNLLRCLQADTSTRAISLAMTALIMFLPHIPNTARQHLPALFNIYSRLLFWDRERRAIHPQSGGEDNEKGENQDHSRTNWEKLPYLLESEDENVPELLHYFTFLYGLYPINFMSYIRKPQRYLRHANFPGADEVTIEPAEIRQRSEPFRQVHLLHTNFFHLTIDTELTENNRWSNSEASDVVTACMALYVPSEDGYEHADRSRGPIKKTELNLDIPEQPLLEQDLATPYQSRHTSWRNTTSTAVSPEAYRQSVLQRRLSQTSQSMPSIADSPSIRPSDHLESPTISPHMLGSHNNQLFDMLNTQRSTRGSLYPSVTNDSVGSLALSNAVHEPLHVNDYLASLSRDDVPRSPSLRPTTTVPAESSKQVAYLHREIQLLENDLNFERYLKQQHLSHIGQLRRKLIREARVEAETQNLINSSKGLKLKLEEAKRLNAQMKKETERSKTHSRKWESDLTAKLRVLRKEQKKWGVERDQLNKDLEIATDNAKSLRQIVVTSERNELAATQKMASVESSLDELDRLRAEVERLTARIRTYEAWEREAARAKEAEADALARVELLQMKLRANDQELTKTREAVERESYAVRSGDDDRVSKKKAALSQEFLDSALATSRSRVVDLKKAHAHLLQRYNVLQRAYTDVREQLQVNATADIPLLGGISSRRSGSASPVPKAFARRKHSSSDPERLDYISTPPMGPLPAIPSRQRVDTGHRPHTSTPTANRSPAGASVHPQFFQAPRPFSPPATVIGTPGTSETGISTIQSNGSSGSSELDAQGAAKGKSPSNSVFARGGKLSSGKRGESNGDGSGKGKRKEKQMEGKKDKKNLGPRGIRMFV